MSALEFFGQLAEFSRRYLGALIPGEPVTAPFSGQEFAEHQPTGAVVHYTADEDLIRVLRWFLIQKYESNVSAHVVIARKWEEVGLELVGDLPLVAALPTMVVQVVEPSQRSWHARRWINDWSYGIELINVGELRPKGGRFFSWRPRDPGAESWTDLWPLEVGTPVLLNGRWWAPYPRAQVEACAELIRQIGLLSSGSLVDEKILGHECIQEDKRDPGPAFPMDVLRILTHDQDSRDWLESFESDPFVALDRWADSIVEEAFFHTFGVDPKLDRYFPEHDEHRRWWKGQGHRIAEGSTSDAVLSAMFQLLGYSGVTPITIKFFQRMMDLQIDGVAGSVTRSAVVARARDRGLI